MPNAQHPTSKSEKLLNSLIGVRRPAFGVFVFSLISL